MPGVSSGESSRPVGPGGESSHRVDPGAESSRPVELQQEEEVEIVTADTLASNGKDARLQDLSPKKKKQKRSGEQGKTNRNKNDDDDVGIIRWPDFDLAYDCGDFTPAQPKPKKQKKIHDFFPQTGGLPPTGRNVPTEVPSTSTDGRKSPANLNSDRTSTDGGKSTANLNSTPEVPSTSARGEKPSVNVTPRKDPSAYGSASYEWPVNSGERHLTNSTQNMESDSEGENTPPHQTPPQAEWILTDESHNRRFNASERMYRENFNREVTGGV